MNSYELSRKFWDWSFENPEIVKPIHSSIYFFAIEHCNRLGWKEKFGLPSQMVMEAIGVKNWRTYSKGLNDLVEYGFIKMIEKSKNQYSSNIIAIVNFTKADTKALDKALQKHSKKQGQSTVSIDKQETIEQGTNLVSYNIFENTLKELADKSKWKIEDEQVFKLWDQLEKREWKAANGQKISNWQNYLKPQLEEMRKIWRFKNDKEYRRKELYGNLAR